VRTRTVIATAIVTLAAIGLLAAPAAAQVACVGGTPPNLVHISPVYASRICQR